MSSMPNIPGLNVPLALRQLGNNVKLYNKLLDQFQKSYASAPQDIAGSIAAGDHETAERNAHTIKGLAGSLGAAPLQEVSAVLEKACRERVTGEAFDQALAGFTREMETTITCIQGYLASLAAPEQQAAPAVNTAFLASKLATLAAHVEDSDAKVLMLFEEIRPQLKVYDPTAAASLASAFEIFDFSAAAGIIAALKAKLG